MSSRDARRQGQPYKTSTKVGQEIGSAEFEAILRGDVVRPPHDTRRALLGLIEYALSQRNTAASE